MDDLIGEILAEMPDPAPQVPFIDLDTQVPFPIRVPADEPWVEIPNYAKDEFEVDGTAAVFSTWRVEFEDKFDLGDTEINNGIAVRSGRIAFNATMTDEKAARLLAALPEGDFILKIKFLRAQERVWTGEQEGDWELGREEGNWVVEDKFDTSV